MRFLRKIPLLVWIVIAIAAGILVGTLTRHSSTDIPVRLGATFGMVFSQLLTFAIPLIILGFITPGIASIGRGAGKLLAKALSLAYTSTVIAGVMAITMAITLYPWLLKGQTWHSVTSSQKAPSILPYGASVAADGTTSLPFTLPPIVPVTTALVLSLLLGIGITVVKTEYLYNIAEEFRVIVERFLQKIIIPILPLYIFTVFSSMTYQGNVQQILTVFGKVFVMVIALHWVYLLLAYSTAGAVSASNPARLLWTMMPAYITALGTQSSAATIPVTLRSARQSGTDEHIVDFAIPLNANIHLAGSMITITSCAAAVMTLTEGHTPTYASLIPLVLVLGIMMVAAPGVPGGAVMTALGALQSMLHFDPTMIAMMIALYLAQDSFGTATNVTGDGALARILSKIR